MWIEMIRAGLAKHSLRADLQGPRHRLAALNGTTEVVPFHNHGLEPSLRQTLVRLVSAGGQIRRINFLRGRIRRQFR